MFRRSTKKPRRQPRLPRVARHPGRWRSFPQSRGLFIMPKVRPKGKPTGLPDASHQSVNHVFSGFSGFQGIQDRHGPGASPQAGVTEHPSGEAERQNPPAIDKAEDPRVAALQGGDLADMVSVVFDGGLRAGAEVWESPMLDFVRWIRTHSATVKLQAKPAWLMVAQILRTPFWKNNTPDGWWQSRFYIDEEDAEIGFLHYWDKVRTAPNADSLDYAALMADLKPLTLLKSVAERRSSKYYRFVGLCAYLQRGAGKSRPIALPVERIGVALGVQPMSVSRYREWGLEDGYLRFHAKGYRAVGNTPGRADEFIFDLKLFPGI